MLFQLEMIDGRQDYNIILFGNIPNMCFFLCNTLYVATIFGKHWKDETSWCEVSLKCSVSKMFREFELLRKNFTIIVKKSKIEIVSFIIPQHIFENRTIFHWMKKLNRKSVSIKKTEIIVIICVKGFLSFWTPSKKIPRNRNIIKTSHFEQLTLESNSVSF